MKKYNRLFVISISVYVILAGIVTIFLTQDKEMNTKTYLIDINRIEHALIDKEAYDTLDVSLYPNIDSVHFIDESIATQKEIEDFYQDNLNNKDCLIRPWFINGIRLGTLKYIYPTPEVGRISFWVVHGVMLCLELSILTILWFLKVQLIQPFSRLSELPIQLAQGNFKGEIHTTKTNYVTSFLWGMAQLKDALDVTRKRQLEVEKEKKQMLLSISHDIKTPLHLIQLYGKAIIDKMYDKEEERMHAANQIVMKSEEIEGYVQDIMKHSREDILDIQIEKSEFYLSEIIKRVETTYKEQCLLRKLDLHIDTYIDRLCIGDMYRLQEVFENLFENAFKYGDGKRIHISFDEEEYCQLIRFYNSGDVVQPQEWNHLFESFYRGANAQGIQGNGLGLYICKTIMRKMDGDIFTQNCENGMMFVLVLR